MEITPEVILGRAALTLTGLLDREMDAIFQRLIEEVAFTAPGLEHKRAVAANRIVLLCRNLAAEIRRYEHLRSLLDLEEEDDENENDLPF
jgi:hypothetical protein